MAVSLLKRYPRSKNGLYRSLFLLDDESEISELPTSTQSTELFGTVLPGSKALVYKDLGGSVSYGLNNNDKWVVISKAYQGVAGDDLDIATSEDIDGIIDEIF